MTSTIPIPQPKPEPLLGNRRQMDSDRPIQGFMRLARTYGPIYKLDLGAPVVILSSQELVNEVCDETRFGKRVAGALRNIRDFAGDGLFTARSEEPNWAIAHRLLMPAFGPIGMRGMFDRMLDIADQMLVRWERFGPSNVIDVADNMTRMTLDTIALCAFDYRFNSFYREDMHPFVRAIENGLAEAGARARRPDLATKVLLHRRRAYEHDLEVMRRVADELIAERRRDPDGKNKKDLLSLMLYARDPVTGEGLSDENIRYQMVTFLIAGHETTSGLLTFATYFLLKNPQVLERARAEVDAALGDELPRVEHLAQLRYLEQVLMETLRIWPTAPAFSLKSLEDETVIGGRYAITRRDTILVLTPMLHRDVSVWGEDVERFRPERFEPETMAKLPPNAWKAFGNGARACIGRPFAMQEATLALAMMLQRFDLIEDDPGYQLQIGETLTLKPRGLRIRVKRRGTASFRPRSVLAQAAAVPEKARKPTAAVVPEGPLTPLLVLYGSNTGSCEAFAERIVNDAAAQGYQAEMASLDDHAGQLPTEGAVLILTASYEGQPPDNARQFAAWLEAQETGALAGVRFAVFGCGNLQWARTYQAVPKQFDAAMEAAGAERLRPRGETDSGGDFFGAFDEWYEGLWGDLGQALGKQVQEASNAPQLQVELVRDARASLLRLSDLQYGEVVENRELVDMSSPLGRSKRHIDIRLPEGMSYRAGDYLAVLAHNPIGVTMRALKRFDLAADTQIIIRKAEGSLTSLPVDVPVNASEVLFLYVELGQPVTRGQVARVTAATEGERQAELQALSEDDNYKRELLARRVTLLELLERYPECKLDFGQFLEMLPPARARQYSISSSPLWNDQRCTLTVAVVDAPALSGQGRYQGMASSYLAKAQPGTRVAVAVRPSNDLFHPPADPETPMIMVCAGTGLAPFHGFLQERAAQAEAGRKVGKALLFFGCDHPDVDLLYKDELRAWEAAGVVSVRPAFFKQPDGDVSFVQHRLWKDRADVAELFRAGAMVYVCGDGARMAPAVRETFVRIYQEAMDTTAEQAAEWADRVERETGRYVSDVFS